MKPIDVKVVEAVPLHAEQIAAELNRCRGADPAGRAIEAIRIAEDAWTITFDDVPACIIGFAAGVSPWVLLTRRAEMREDALDPASRIALTLVRERGRTLPPGIDDPMAWLESLAYRVPGDPGRLDFYFAGYWSM